MIFIKLILLKKIDYFLYSSIFMFFSIFDLGTGTNHSKKKKKTIRIKTINISKRFNFFSKKFFLRLLNIIYNLFKYYLKVNFNEKKTIFV